jgi:hypothetical protein
MPQVRQGIITRFSPASSNIGQMHHDLAIRCSETGELFELDLAHVRSDGLLLLENHQVEFMVNPFSASRAYFVIDFMFWNRLSLLLIFFGFTLNVSLA